MSEGNGTTGDIQLLWRQTEFASTGESHGGEGLVHLKEINSRYGPRSTLERHLHCTNRSRRKPLGGLTIPTLAYDPSHRMKVMFVRVLL